MDRIITKTMLSTPKIPAKLRGAAYARVSCRKEAMLHSLAAQVSYYRTLIQQRPDWEYLGVYADEALTGTKDSRAEFQRLLADSEGGRIDLILTKSLSRFARNTVTLLETVRNLKRLGVDVYFEEQNIHSISADGELMLTILASYAQEESLSASENCKWRIRNNFKEGIPTSLRIYGYDYVGGKLVVTPKEAEIVKMIFTDYLSDMGKNAIMRKLLSLGIPTKSNGTWSESTVDHILRDEKYTGNMLLQKTYSENHLTKAKKINRGELQMFFAEATHEAIISMEMFEAVQKKLARRAKEHMPNPRTPVFSEFTGKIHCGLCGANFRRKIGNVGTKYANPIWSCSTYNSKGKAYCASRQIPEEILRQTASSVLSVSSYDPAVFSAKVKEICVPENGVLVFVLADSSQVTRVWEHKSRSESWTGEMKAAAREKAKEDRQNVKC